jgi:hypothetical protein
MNRSNQAIDRLEAGEKVLNVNDLIALETIFGVDWYEIAGKPRHGAATERHGLAEDAEPYVAAATSALYAWRLRPTQSWLSVKSGALSAIGYAAGDVVIIDNGAEVMAQLANGDAVAVTVGAPGQPGARTLLRQFIEPDLLITNSLADNELPIDRRRDDVAIMAKIVTRLTQIVGR